jgi:hypothetical protein
LANPYPYPLEWTGELEVFIRDDTPAGNRPSCIWRASGKPAYLPGDANREAVFNNAFFRIPKDTLEPGEAKAWTIGSQAFRRKGSGTRKIIVKLVPFDRSNPSDLENSVVLEDKNVNNISDTLRLDVRESWTTSQPTVVLRMPGARRYDPPLREIQNLELDNGYFSPNTRNITSANARRMNRAFPLMLYSYQICQPGTNYKQYLPSGSKLGLRGSTLRTYMDFNLQAAWFKKPIACYTPPPYFLQSNDSIASLPFRAPGGDTGSDFTKNLAISPIPWGHSVSGARKTVLFSPPRDYASLAQFQHLDLTADDKTISIACQPGYAVGNSYASPFLKRKSTIESRKDYTILGIRKGTAPKAVRANYYDISYLLNTALWDTYYFSTISSYSQGLPKNRNIVLYHTQPGESDLNDGVEAAAHLMIHGAQNVNSTSKDAWKALLASTRHMKHAADGGASLPEAMFPRSLEQPVAAELRPTGKDEDSFAGFRRLTDDQIDAVAEELARQVRLRGPFVSLSHFINRTLVDLSKDRELSRSGPLQASLDETGVNISADARKNAFSRVNAHLDQVALQNNGKYPRADLDGRDPTFFPNTDKAYAPESRDNNPGSMASIIADRTMMTNSRIRTEQGFRSTGIPGWLTQADVLQAIGPLLSVRSDTFRIRAYGEAVDPNGKTIARAWCEAVVQRTPEYVDPSNRATDRGAQLTKRNQIFGRRFQMVSFRWLSADEI